MKGIHELLREDGGCDVGVMSLLGMEGVCEGCHVNIKCKEAGILSQVVIFLGS